MAAATATNNALWSLYASGIQGGTLASFAANITSHLNNAMRGAGIYPTVICINYGVNDIVQGTTANYEANYLTAVDAIHARWPDALIYISKVWSQGNDTICDTLATKVDNVIAARSFTRLADDERVWLKGADNGATMTTDGVHYSVAGQAEKLNQMKTVLGY